MKKTKILVLDEATASIDYETDQILQSVVKKEFHDRTVLMIAHRIGTILDCDKIMVLNEGVLKEFDSPKVLLDDSQSIFYSLVHQ